MKNNINTNPMPGFMELLPNEQIVFNNILKTIRETYESFGFRSIETPLIERAEVLLTKGSGETDKQIYRFKKGDNDLALRFDLTIPLARYVANNQNDLVFPFKVCNIGKVYRGRKNPKPGDLENFINVTSISSIEDDLDLSFDAELVKAVTTLFKNLSFDNFIMKLNNRKIMNGFFNSLEINDPTEVLRSIDKLEKQGEKSVKDELKCSGLTDDTISQIFDFVSITGDIIPQLKDLKIKNAMFKEGLEELEQLEKQIKILGVDDKKWTIDLTIARGLDYYTGTVYETFLTDYPEFGSVCSGGRYDDLASYYTNTKLPGVGCSIGLTRLFDCLLRNNLLDVSKSSPTDVLIIGMENYEANAASLGDIFRNKGLNAEIRFGIKGGFKYADKLGIPYVIIIGEEEIDKNVYTLKDMKSGEQISLDLENLFSKLGA